MGTICFPSLINSTGYVVILRFNGLTTFFNSSSRAAEDMDNALNLIKKVQALTYDDLSGSNMLEGAGTYSN